MTQPSAAEQARTVLAHARVAMLTTYPRLGRSLTTAVAIGDEGGDVVLQLTRDSSAAADLALRPVASLRIAPPDQPTVVVTGSAHLLPQRDPRQLSTFRLQIKAVRLGEAPGIAVPVSQFRAAQPDPLAGDRRSSWPTCARIMAPSWRPACAARGTSTPSGPTRPRWTGSASRSTPSTLRGSRGCESRSLHRSSVCATWTPGWPCCSAPRAYAQTAPPTSLASRSGSRWG